MKQIGYVFDVEGKRATIDVKRVSACGENCADCSSSCKMPTVRVNVENTLEAKKGDYVEISSESKTILKYTFLIYGIPLIIMLGAIAISMALLKKVGYTGNDSLSLVIGLLFLGLSYFILKRVDNNAKGKIEFKMTRIMNQK
ncbi:SoxR reducing system RseC family protein [Clostridiaceae bacterium M8S5]|nr:SoxR reducing system RseC family protein [Clostridiaceae bacterium M8S5]